MKYTREAIKEARLEREGKESLRTIFDDVGKKKESGGASKQKQARVPKEPERKKS